MTTPPLPRWIRSTPVLVCVAYLIGRGFNSIEGVVDPDTLWVGNLSWPYLALPALACVGEARLSRRVIRPMLTSLAMVLGFYHALGLLWVSAESMGLPPSTSWLEVERTAWRSYLELLVLGVPGGIPWISVSLVTGAALGATYHLAVRDDRARAAALWGAVALVGLAEPVFHFAPVFAGLPFAGYRFDGPGRLVTIIETAVALSLLAGAIAFRAPRRARPGP